MSASRRKPARRGSKPSKVFAPGLDYLRDGFVARCDTQAPFHRLHCHDDIEVAVNQHSSVVAMFGAERIVLPPDYLTVFWAARPHGPIEAAPSWQARGIHVPLPWVLQWRLPPIVMRPLLAGQVLLDPPGQRPVGDAELVASWHDLMRQDAEEARRVVLLEVEARLRRLAMDLASRAPGEPSSGQPLPYSPGALGRFERMAALIATHFREPLSVEDIALAVKMQPAPAMRLFRKYSGMTIHEYLLRHRVGHAQCLLAAGDARLDDIAAESGFGSAARFYACFGKLVGQSPAAYRRSMQGGGA
jgi:AraC-like DNA-binding protein